MKDKKFIYLVENKNTEDLNNSGEFLLDEIKEREYEWNFLFKISIDLEVPELHIDWEIGVNLFKLLLNILDKMKLKIYFIVDLDYLLNKENDFKEILKELNYRLNFKIYSESIVYDFKYYREGNITNEQLDLLNKIYTQMISNDWNIFILKLKSLNSCLLDKLLKTNEEMSINVFNSEEMSNGKKKIIYYRQWEFITNKDEEPKIIEGLSYRNYIIKHIIFKKYY